MSKYITKILAGLLCLLLLVGFLPADILGDLIPKADAAYIDYVEQDLNTQQRFNGLFILRNPTNPNLVLTVDNHETYVGSKAMLFWKELGEGGIDIRKQIFLFRQTDGTTYVPFENQYYIYIRPLFEVYRKSFNSAHYGDVWLTSTYAAYCDSVSYNSTDNSVNSTAQPETNADKFKFGINLYDTNYDYNGYPCFTAGIHDFQRNGTGSTYYLSNNNGSDGYCYTVRADATNATANSAMIFQPVSYGVPDDKTITLMCQLAETTQYYLRSESGSAVDSPDTANSLSHESNWTFQWTAVRADNGYYALVNNQYERYLAIDGNNNAVLGNSAMEKTTDDLGAMTWTKPQDAELWQIIPYQYGVYQAGTTTFLLINKATGRLLLKSAATGNATATGSFYNTDTRYSLWQIRYSEMEQPNNWVTRTNRYVQTNFDGADYIRYPMSITINGAASSAYHTLQLGEASTPRGYLVDDINTSIANLEGKDGYVFDTTVVTSGTASRKWPNSVTFDTDNSIIKNANLLYRVEGSGTNSINASDFKINDSMEYAAKIAFQFDYTADMFFQFYGVSGGVTVNVYEAGSSTPLLTGSSTRVDTATELNLSTLTPGQTYTMVIDKHRYGNTDGSHFAIFTNVKPITVHNELVDNKTTLFDLGINVYQDGNALALNGAAVIGTPLEYGITVTNNSVYNLLVQSFSSPVPVDNETQISHWGIRNLGGFKVTSAGAVDPGNATDKYGNTVELNDLVFNVYHGKELIGTLKNPTTANQVTNFLTYVPNDASGNTTYGLPTGWTIEVRGIFYQPTEADLDIYARKMVYPEATAKFHAPSISTVYHKYGDNTSVHFTNEPFFIQWAGQNMTVKKELLFELIQKAGKHKYEIEDQLLNASNITSLMIANNDGSPNNTPNIAVENNTNLVLKHANAGRYQYNIKVNFNGTFAFVPIQVFVYDVSDDVTFVLDYGLPVVLDKNRYTTSSDFSQPYNKLEINEPFETTITIQQITGTEPGHDGTYLIVTDDLTTAYGTISLDANNGNITYTPTAFLDGADYIYVVFKVVRSGSNTNLGVKVADELLMYKTITILPGNVIYYEDTIGSITYPDGYILDELGELTDTGVSGEQDFPSVDKIGYDDGSYANAKDVMLSGESVHKVTVNNEQVTVSFTFTGTGFELISRVNAQDSATILVQVSPAGQDNWKFYPVITRFNPTGNPESEATVYQVPVFRLNEIAYGEYDVQIIGLPKAINDEYNSDGTPKNGYEVNYIYIDGIRVYNPLNNGPLTSHYGAEQGAQFTNLRDLILDGQGMVAAYTNTVTSFTSGSYYYVATDDEWFTAAMGSVNELGAIGANNEIYIRDTLNHIVVLKVKETSAGSGLLQVGIHDVHDARFDGNDGKNDPSTVSYNTGAKWEPLVTGTYSGTEQYYSIDLSKCPTDGDYRIVVLRVDSGFVSFSNIKHKNVEFGSTGAPVLDIYTKPGYFFDEKGNMCSKDADGKVTVHATAAQVVDINKLNGILAGNE